MDIEEDIKILKNLKKYLNLLIYEGTHKIIYNDLGWDEKTIDCINAIEHILAERESDKKRIKDLEEENHLQRKQIMSAYDKGWIPKQKVLKEVDKLLNAFRKIEFNKVTIWNSLIQLKENLLEDK